MARSFARLSVLGVRPTKLWRLELRQLGQQHLHLPTTPPPARQPRPQRTSVAINPSEVLHQARVTMVNGTATEAQAFDDVMGEFGASSSDGGVWASDGALLTWHYDTNYCEFSKAAYAPYMNGD